MAFQIPAYQLYKDCMYIQQEVRVQGSERVRRAARVIANLDDAALRRYAVVDLAYAHHVAEQDGVGVTEDGLLSASVNFGLGAPSWRETAARLVNADAIRVRVTREEQRRCTVAGRDKPNVAAPPEI